MLFADYQSLVLQEYARKKASGDLSHRMTRLTPAKFKEECEAVCAQRYDRKDEKTLEEFFDAGGDKMVILRAIKRCHPDKFRPLVNVLKGKTRLPDEKIIELLAWLIDFKPRPYELGRNYDAIQDIPDKEQDEVPINKDEKVKEVGVAHGSAQGRGKVLPAPGITAKTIAGFGKGKIVMGAIVLAAVVGVIYWARSRSSTAGMTGPQACMFWAADHYQPITCGQRHGDALVIPLDSEKLVHFRKITRPDTITENAEGSVWYVIYRGVYEYYTSRGYHPIDTNLRLRPLKDFVLLKHLHPGQEVGRTSE
jgi:hypothetical protein